MAVNKQLHKTHGAANHQQNIKVQSTDDLAGGKHAGEDEQHTGSQGDIGTEFAEGNHQYIGCGEENNSW